MLCIGFSFSGIGCSLYVYCSLGSDAFNVLTQGVACVLNMQVGNAFYLTQAVLLLFIAVVRKHYIGIGTLLGTFIIGAVMNIWALLLAPLLQAADVIVRLCCLATQLAHELKKYDRPFQGDDDAEEVACRSIMTDEED